MKKLLKNIGLGISVAALSITLVACGAKKESRADINKKLSLNNMKLEEIVEKAKMEGHVNSVGMPDKWANWKGTWDDLKKNYGIEHIDTDMSSAEELAVFENEKQDASADIGDVGIAFGPQAVNRCVALAYKTSYYNEIPDWAKDPEGEGYWMFAYTGTMAFLVDTEATNGVVPKSWKELRDGNLKTTIGDVSSGNQDQFMIHSAAVAFGGDENNLEPGFEFYAEMAEKGRLNVQGANVATLESGEHQVVPMWDFNALARQVELGKERFKVVIPQDGASVTGYTTIINAYTKNPHAAALAREYILSDAGQNNLARRFARRRLRTNRFRKYFYRWKRYNELRT